MINTCFFQIIKKRKLVGKYNPVNSFLETYNYENLFKNGESADTTRKSDKEESVDSSDMPPLEGDEKIKRIKNFDSK